MGNSRAIFVAVLSVIFGAYTVSFNQTDKRHARIGIVRAHALNAESVARAAAGGGLNSILRAYGYRNYGPISGSLGGGTYSVILTEISSGLVRITATSNAGNQTATHIIYAQVVGGSYWSVTKSYSFISPPNYASALPTD